MGQKRQPLFPHSEAPLKRPHEALREAPPRFCPLAQASAAHHAHAHGANGLASPPTLPSSHDQRGPALRRGRRSRRTHVPQRLTCAASLHIAHEAHIYLAF